MDFVDSNYEFNAPQYVDFLNDADDKNIDKWFDEHPGHEGGIRLSMVPFVDKPSDFESVTKAISAALNENGASGFEGNKMSVANDVGASTMKVEDNADPGEAMNVDDAPVLQSTTKEENEGQVKPTDTDHTKEVKEFPPSTDESSKAQPSQQLSNVVKTWGNDLVYRNSGKLPSIGDKPRKPMTRSRSLERPKPLKRKSSSCERKTKDDAECNPSEEKKSKMEIKKPMLTIAHTPELLRRVQGKKGPSLISSEQAEMDMVKKLKAEAEKLKKRSINSYKKAMASGPYMPTRSRVDATRPVDFSFATDNRVKPHPMTLRADSEKSFETQLRQHPPSPTFKHRKATKPVPFNFTKEIKKKDVKPGKWESLASSVSNFQTKTPERFHMRLRNIFKFRSHLKGKQEQTNIEKRNEPKLTEPKTPMLTTKGRKRPVTVQSYAEEEEKIIQEMKSYKFKATELDPRIIDHGGIIGLPQKKEFPKTEIKPFEFRSDMRLEVRKKKEDPETDDSYQLMNERKRSGSTSSQKSVTKERCTRPEPFSFEQRNKEIQLRKEKKIQEIYEEEQKAREFHAQPLPSLSPDLVIHHDHKKTQIQPFNLESQKRHLLCEQKWNEQINRMKENEKAKQIFKAKSNTVTHKAPFQPLKGQIPPTEITSFKLNTEERAVKREEFDAKLKEYQRLTIMEMEEQKMLEEKEAEEEIAKLRREAIHKANPIRKYKEVEVLPSDKPATNPVTPHFETSKRSRRGIRV